MGAPLPNDPLDIPIAEFVAAIDAFLSVNPDFDPPEIAPAATLADLQRVWEDCKHLIRKAHASFVGVQPEVTVRLEAVAAKGAVVLELTADPLIVDPVTELMELMVEVRGVIDHIGSVLGKAASALGFVALLLEYAGLKTRIPPLSARVVAARDALIAYNLMRPRPGHSA
jgi:hypothetical protein